MSITDFSSAGATVTASLSWGRDVDEVTLNLVYYQGDRVAPRTVEGGRWLVGSRWPLESARSAVFEVSENEGGG